MYPRSKSSIYYHNHANFNSFNRPTGGYDPSLVRPPYSNGYHNPYQPCLQENNIKPNANQYFNQRAVNYTQKSTYDSYPEKAEEPNTRSQVNLNLAETRTRMEKLKASQNKIHNLNRPSSDVEVISIPVKVNSKNGKLPSKDLSVTEIRESQLESRDTSLNNRNKTTEINPFDSSRFKLNRLNHRNTTQIKKPSAFSTGSSIVPKSQAPVTILKNIQEGIRDHSEDITKIYSDDYRKNILLKKKVKNRKKDAVSNRLKEERTRQKIQQILAGERTKNSWQKALVNIFVLTLFITSSISGLFVWNQYSLNSSIGQVAGASDERFSNFEEYKKWVIEKAGEYLPPDEDLDGDGLTNYEEFLINSDPTSKYSCDENKSDMENLLSLIHPATCKPIDLEDEEERAVFSKIIDFEMVKENFLENEKDAETEDPNQSTSQNNLLQIFQVASFQELDNIDSQQIEQTKSNLDKKKEYLRLVQKIDEYIKRYRSYDIHDRNYPEPVHPAIYLQVSLEYDVPLRYVLAVARKESRFGTDRYTASGQLTRPGRFQNIYSIGLDDSGNNHLYETWEDGVRGFGRWYQSFEQRGVDDCRKWRIYNPNGDYCQVIENLANQIQIFLDSE